MKIWLHKAEKIIDLLIPYCLIILIIILVMEIGFRNFVEEQNLRIPIDVADYFIIFIFIIDLIFKYVRVRNIPKFFRKYWLEIIAVFPFFLIFRLAELAFGFSEISEGIKTAQSITHSTTEIEKEVALLRGGEKMLKEGEVVVKLERSTRLSRYVKPLARIPRFLKKVPEMLHFYEKPSGEHHPHEFTKR